MKIFNHEIKMQKYTKNYDSKPKMLSVKLFESKEECWGIFSMPAPNNADR